MALDSKSVPPRKKISSYPEKFLSIIGSREKRQLGDFFGISTFGVNLTRLPTNSQSSIFHKHSHQQEFIFILEGEVVLVFDFIVPLVSGMCAGFLPSGPPHNLVNRSSMDAWIIEISDRPKCDNIIYPKDDLAGKVNAQGTITYSKKNGSKLA